MKKILNQFPSLRNSLISLRHQLWVTKTTKNLKTYLADTAVAKLQLGAGTNVLPGWFNTDYFPRDAVYFMDVTKPFPVPDASFNFIFSEHHIEHISYKNAVFMLKESFRVLKPGGSIRITTPHLKNVLNVYSSDGPVEGNIFNHTNEFIYSGFYNAINYIPVDDYVKAHELNDMFYNYEHKFIYDFESLKRVLEYTGFKNVTDCSQKSTAQKEFENIETHISDFDRYTTLAVEAEKC
jgi:ubiquinone/menaquinone biosynthesis C-methylase UbiE